MGYRTYAEPEKEINLLKRKLTPVEAKAAAGEAIDLAPAEDMEKIAWQKRDGHIKGKGADSTLDVTAPEKKYVPYVEPAPEESTSVYDQVNSGKIPEVGGMRTGTDWDNWNKGGGVFLGDTQRGARQTGNKVLSWLDDKFEGTSLGRKVPFMPDPKANLAKVDQEIAEARIRDAPVMATESGKIGYGAGATVATAPVAPIKKLQTVVGSGIFGGALGATQPTQENESSWMNAIKGALFSMIAPVAKGTWDVGKAVTDPLHGKGRTRLAAGTAEHFGIKEKDVAGLTSDKTSTGAQPTLAELIRDKEAKLGAAGLQDTLRQLPDQARKFSMRDADNLDARTDVLSSLAGRKPHMIHGQTLPTTLQTRKLAEREVNAKKNYDAARIPFDLKSQPQTVQDEFESLSKTPAFKKAAAAAEESAGNRRIDLTDPKNKIAHFDLIRRNMKDARDAAWQKGHKQEGNDIQQTRQALTKFIEDASAPYKHARIEYVKDSIPVNQHNIFGHILDKGTSGNKSILGDDLIKPGTLANMMRDEEKIIRQATEGKSQGKQLTDVLTPAQKAKLDTVVKEVSNEETVRREGMGRGSPTAKRTAGINVIDKLVTALVGPALGKTVSNSSLGYAAASVPNIMYKSSAEPRIQEILTTISLNPGSAPKVMASLSPKNRNLVQKFLESQAMQHVFRSSLPAYYFAHKEGPRQPDEDEE